MPDPLPASTIDGRERILSSALHLFATRGYGRTTTKAIVDHAGVATGLLFYHFDSKEDLLRAVLAEKNFGPQLRGVVDELSSDPTEALVSAGTKLLRLTRANSEFITVLVGSREVEPDHYTAFQSDVDAAVSELGRHLAGSLSIRSARARVAAGTFVGALLSATVVMPTRGSDRNLVRLTADIVLGGVAGAAS